jgi:hypothetical protein
MLKIMEIFFLVYFSNKSEKVKKIKMLRTTLMMRHNGYVEMSFIK